MFQDIAELVLSGRISEQEGFELQIARENAERQTAAQADAEGVSLCCGPRKIRKSFAL